MSLLYNVVQKKNPQDKNANGKYYLVAKSRGSVSWEELLDAACEGTTADRDEVRLAMSRVFKKAENYLDLGFNVSLGDMGYLELSLRSEGARSEGEAIASSVEDIVPHFIFGEKIRSRLKKTRLEKA